MMYCKNQLNNAEISLHTPSTLSSTHYNTDLIYNFKFKKAIHLGISITFTICLNMCIYIDVIFLNKSK
jgi:hypothetical protein